jgi:hypothetical protein
VFQVNVTAVCHGNHTQLDVFWLLGTGQFQVACMCGHHE